MRDLLVMALLIVLCSTVSGRFYQITEFDTGWTTGLRQSSNASLDIAGSALGQGTYYRYTDMDFNDVRMCERISAANGTMDTRERIRLIAETIEDVEFIIEKSPGSQNYLLVVNETWPVAMSALRRMDYIGRGISDRELFENNLDYVGTSYYQATDLKKERSCYLELQDAWFEAYLNNTTKTLYYDKFLPNKILEYSLESRSQGLAELKYRQSQDRSPAKESVESYEGGFSIARNIFMGTYRHNLTVTENDYLECCFNQENHSLLEKRVFGSDFSCLLGCFR